MLSLDSHGSRRITRRSYGTLGESNCQKPTLIRLSSMLLKIDKGGKKLKKKKNFERNYSNKVHQKRTEQEPNRPCLKKRRYNDQTKKPNPETLLSRRNEDQGNFLKRIPHRTNEPSDLTKLKPELRQNRPLLTGDNDDRTKGNFL